MLLPSGPDMVHGFILHRTEIFKHLVLWADFTNTHPSQSNSASRKADFELREPLPPRLARYI